MADALAAIDPNTENGEESKAFIKKMYKIRGEVAEDNKAFLPETPELCIDIVAGKVIQVENLQEDLDEVHSFNEFFADVYSSAYKNALVTMTDGISQVFPGGLDGPIEDEIHRIYGHKEGKEMDAAEVTAIEAFINAVENGSYEMDFSTLIDAGEPL